MRALPWKPGILLAAVAALIVHASCGDDLRIVGISLDIDRQTVSGFLEPPVDDCDEESEQILGPEGALVPFSVDFEEQEELQGVDLTLLARVELERIVLEIVDEAPGGDEDDFDFVDVIRIFADDPNDDQEEVLVAELDPVPQDRKRIVIPGTGVDIREIARDEFIVRGEVEGRPPCDEVNFVGEAEFEVTLF